MALTPDEIDGLRELILAVYGPVTEELLRICAGALPPPDRSSGDEYKLLLAAAKSLAAGRRNRGHARSRTGPHQRRSNKLMSWAAEKTAPREENESLRNIAEAYVKVTRKEVTNVLGQLAAADVDGRVYPIKDVYRRTMDYVFRQVSSGAKTPEEAVRRATLRLWQRGIRTVDRSDRRTFSVEFMAQRAIMAKMGEMTTAINKKHHDDGGCDGWEISAHSASAPDHEPYQGRQYSDKEYKRLNSRLAHRHAELQAHRLAHQAGRGQSPVDGGAAGGDGAGKREGHHLRGPPLHPVRSHTAAEGAGEQHPAVQGPYCRGAGGGQAGQRRAAQQPHPPAAAECGIQAVFGRGRAAHRAGAAAGGGAGPGAETGTKTTLELPRPAGTLTGSGGKLDVEEARKSYSAYLDTLTDAPEKNMVWLRYFTEKNPTEYVEDGTLDAPFAYDPVEDRILYNPRHPQFSTTDFEMANTHELAHRTDVLNAQGYKNKAFVDAIADASKAVLDNAEGFQRVAQAVRSDLMKDILSALSSGRLDTGFGHKAEYWAKKFRSRPVGDICGTLLRSKRGMIRTCPSVKKLFPGLWKEYQKLF